MVLAIGEQVERLGTLQAGTSLGGLATETVIRIKKSILRIVGLGDPSHPLILRYQSLRRKMTRQDLRMRDSYLKGSEIPKLHIGASNHVLEGWLNTDLSPQNGVMFLDATKSYPFRDGAFAYVYSEHMIEHVPYEGGQIMLQECYRVLRPGGIIRIVTPNLASILGLYSDALSVQQREYLNWMSRTFTPRAPEKSAVFVINAFFRLWGHQFIYDEAGLAAALRSAGFNRVRRVPLGSSDHPPLRKLENTSRYPEGLLNFESVCLEAIK